MRADRGGARGGGARGRRLGPLLGFTGVREAVVAGDAPGAARQAAVLADAIRRVADRVRAPEP